ncbi:peptide/nickel transport system substrate-binding protein [Micromonospora pattaloongensis]|uniref:Peptide/nickel transport system substrate-binding protein n=1 Tax=Micromonospora pattaloongensis TaxID=405436 RepID=A0A1H3JSF9_9ACTN|nr:ABC transporter substrate-binding protein [Micromonospora pattaloongensis]SDY42831.1 peptide/nickel transport system substrate-binding protein [Micromonospora pattaloongensis]
MVWGRPAVAGVAMVVSAVLVACSGPPGAAGGRQPRGGPNVLRVVGPFELHSLDPARSDGFFTRLRVAETLVDADGRGDLRPGLAAAWRVSDDQRAWTFSLRPDTVFHDGTKVTAETVAASLTNARGERGTPWGDAPVAAITANAGEVQVQLDRPYAPLPAVLAHAGTQVLAPASYNSDRTVKKVIGTGPYRVERIEQPSAIEVVAFEGWAGKKPDIERISYQAVGRAETRALMAESGQADVTLGIDPVSRQRVQRAAGVEIKSVTLPRTILLKVNAGHRVLGDLRVRQAVSAALDRKAMATALLRDPEMAATQFFPPSLSEWHQDSVPPLAHDPSQARELLAQAGWAPGPDGVLTRNGQRFEISLRTFPDRPELPVLATAVQAALKELGIRVNVQVGNSSEIPAGHKDGTLELGLYARNFALVPDPLVTLLNDYGPRGADWGAMGWSNAELARTLSDLADGTDAAAAAAGRQQVSGILQRELPVIPVAWYRQSAVVSDRVNGFTLDPLERSWLIDEVRWSS